LPSVPQELAVRSTQVLRGSSVPALASVHLPGADDSAQLLQAPSHASAQQTPSTQKPLAHWPAPAQVCPFDFGPQLPLTQPWPLAQSASVWQWLTQALPAHWNGSQSSTPGERQVPRPSQVPAVLSRSPLQVGSTQTVSAAYLEQPPTPSQTPDCPQLDAGLRAQTPWGSAAPSAVGPQTPIRPVCAQLTQGPVQATLQQTPSAQKPEAHCDPAWQTAPSGLGPQLPFTHLDPTQSLSEAQVAAQAPVIASQVNGAQMTVGPAVQVPSPSQTRPPMTAAPSQVPGAQVVPATKLRQAPAPSHVPSRPQVDGSEAGQTLALRGAPPAGTNAQVPGAPAVLHDLHVSVQAVLQQTPSTQNPLAQSPAHPQAAPLAPVILLVPLQATTGAPLPPSGTDTSMRDAPEWLLQPVAQRPSHPTATAPRSRAARKLIISPNVSPGPLRARRALG
jgi:hypothetical protein